MRPKYQLYGILACLSPVALGQPQEATHTIINALSNRISLSSPNEAVSGDIFIKERQLHYRVFFNDQEVILDSPLGITINEHNLGKVTSLESSLTRQVHTQYQAGNSRSLIPNHYIETTVSVVSSPYGAWRLQARAYNDGFAYRYILPSQSGKTSTVIGEASSWTLPANSQVWFFERDSDWKLKTYAGQWQQTAIENLPKISKTGPVQGPPLVVEIPVTQSYAVLSEAALYQYSGMRLRAVGNNRLQVDFTEGKTGFTVPDAKPITTPWRVIMLGEDLDALVNSNLIANLNPSPDKTLFANLDYIRPGRSVWRWWSLETGTPEQERTFVDYAHELGFEYSLVDDGWEDWPHPWEALADVTNYANEKDVDIIVWKDWNQVSDAAGNWKALREFLDSVREAEAAGVKLDFMNSESLDRILFEEAVLRLAAERELMVVFHGIQKPTGESRTYPNEISREAIRGLELNRMNQPLPASHNAALPFTRFLVGHGDYTPLGYTRPGDTTYAHQLASVVLFTSPFQVIAEHPKILLEDETVAAGLEMLKAIPTTWNETRVLKPSSIGKLAIMARRSGKDWFLAALNGTDKPTSVSKIDLSFLGEGGYSAQVVFSPRKHQLQRQRISSINRSTTHSFTLLPSDGYIMHFTPLTNN